MKPSGGNLLFLHHLSDMHCCINSSPPKAWALYLPPSFLKILLVPRVAASEHSYSSTSDPCSVTFFIVTANVGCILGDFPCKSCWATPNETLTGLRPIRDSSLTVVVDGNLLHQDYTPAELNRDTHAVPDLNERMLMVDSVSRRASSLCT